jgi:hypothetical protein
VLTFFWSLGFVVGDGRFKMGNNVSRTFGILAAALAIVGLGGLGPTYAQADDPGPPAETVKLIFIHHSTGENWLTDGYGDLGRALEANNYFVSDTNYGWGPDGIGDRTDIINWPEWFRGSESERYLAALYAESGQHAGYTRNLSDPGGENEIIMFKSCFPNSELEGNPDDPPAAGEGLTVSHAKYIYTDLLNYFVTRPDKLFVVITAPPLQDPTYAANARAFNTWLMEDWLTENEYPYNNVAVWDFYNVLTGADHHHRYHNGAIEHVFQPGQNILYYPSDDDHPSVAGSQKATDEFVPMLNLFYQRWKASAPAQPTPRPTTAEQPEPTPTATAEAQQEPTRPAAAATEPPTVSRPVGLIDDFEAGDPPGTRGWQAFYEQDPASINCTLEEAMARGGSASGRMDFDVAADSWASCALLRDAAQDWRAGEGLSFYLHAEQPGLVFAIVAHGGSPDGLTTYEHELETPPASVDGWTLIEVPWEQLLRVAWEEDAGSVFDPAQAMGLSFAFNGLEGAANRGTIWVDDIQLMEVGQVQEPAAAEISPTAAPSTSEAATEASPNTAPPTQAQPESQAEGGDKGGLCSSSLALVAAAVAGGLWTRRRKGNFGR